jgi:Zn-dependent M28 family amino/carboxypeptidase
MPRMLRLTFPSRLLPLLAAALLAGSARAAEADASVTRMKKDLYFLASEECEGRGVETQGINKAADHIAATFKELGLKPALPDGTYFQPFGIPGAAKLGAPNSLVLKGPLGQEIAPPVTKQFSVSGLTGKGKASAPLVFVGYGITTDAYDDYKGIDAAGKIVVVLRRTPRFESKEAPFPDTQQHAALQTKVTNAETHKAAAIVFVSDRGSAGADDPLMPFDYARGGGAASVPTVHIKRALADRLLASLDTSVADVEKAIDADLKPRSSELKGWTATVETTVERKEIAAKNVIGVLEGKGPLANETVVIGAHYDHLGRGERGSLARGSTAVHYGADDNGSGTTAVLELARRFAAMKDREGRRLVFMTFSGEERGLLGSRHYCQHPAFPLKDTVAMINLDMVGRLRDDPKTKKGKLEVGGLGSAKSFEALGDELNKKYDFDVKKTRSGVGPSDHTSFYLKGVPVFFFFTGMHPEYHRPTDKPDTINFEGMKKVVDMVEELTTRLATEKQRPEYVASKSPAPGTGSPRGVPTIRFMPGDYDDDQSNGVLVGGVIPGGPAAQGGLKEGDWIVAIAGQPVKNMAGYMKVMGGQKAGAPVEFTVKRNDKQVALKVTPLPPAPPKE